MNATTHPETTNGIFDAIPRAVYESWPAINHSRLKLFRDPPAKAKHNIDNPREPSAALDMGHAVHTAILEPELFEADFIAAPTLDRRSKEGKTAWADFQEANGSRIILAPDDYETCISIRDSIWEVDSVARSILKATGRNERSFVWHDPATKALCKGRCDRMAMWNDWTVVVDVKTTRSAAPDEFARDIAKFQYASQAAFYLDGLTALAPVERRWFWIALEKDQPYLHAIYEPTDRLVEQGRNDYRRWLEIYLEAMRTDHWPGYPNGIVPLDVPRWAQDLEVVNGSL